MKVYQTPWVRLMASTWESWRLDPGRVTPKPHSWEETKPGTTPALSSFKIHFLFVFSDPHIHTQSKIQ